jgi:hypothetical protein
MKAYLRIIIVAIAFLIFGGAAGYISGARSRGSHFSNTVRQLALVHAAGEASIYSQVLRSLREGDEVAAIDRLENLLDSAVSHVGEYYAPEYEEQMPWIGHAVHCALDYRTIYPHRPSSDWAAKRYDAALALKTEEK